MSSEDPKIDARRPRYPSIDEFNAAYHRLRELFIMVMPVAKEGVLIRRTEDVDLDLGGKSPKDYGLGTVDYVLEERRWENRGLLEDYLGFAYFSLEKGCWEGEVWDPLIQRGTIRLASESVPLSPGGYWVDKETLTRNLRTAFYERSKLATLFQDNPEIELEYWLSQYDFSTETARSAELQRIRERIDKSGARVSSEFYEFAWRKYKEGFARKNAPALIQHLTNVSPEDLAKLLSSLIPQIAAELREASAADVSRTVAAVEKMWMYVRSREIAANVLAFLVEVLVLIPEGSDLDLQRRIANLRVAATTYSGPNNYVSV